MYLISQIFVVLSYALLAITYIEKNRARLLSYNFASLIANGVAFLLLGAYSGFATIIIAVIRNTIFLIRNKDNSEEIDKIDVIVLIGLVIACIISAVITYDGFGSLLSIIATLLYTISIWQKNNKIYKLMGVPVGICWILYNIFITSLFGVILETILFFVVIIEIIKLYKKKAHLS